MAYTPHKTLGVCLLYYLDLLAPIQVGGSKEYCPRSDSDILVLQVNFRNKPCFDCRAFCIAEDKTSDFVTFTTNSLYFWVRIILDSFKFCLAHGFSKSQIGSASGCLE